jgi:3-hydroxyacyl-[acyl-carrier-protein] dehydratase
MFDTTVVLNEEQIKEMIPHRDPLLLLDTVHTVESKKRIVASKLLSAQMPIFEGHFPGNPIYPGVYYIESIAQAGALLFFLDNTTLARQLQGVMASVESARFRRPSRPGDRVYYDVHIERQRLPFVWVKGSAYVGNDMVAEASLCIAVTVKDKEEK